jgi:hypothetical protein
MWLQVGAVLFLVGGVVDALIGALTPIVTRISMAADDTFLANPAADRSLYGESPQALIGQNAPLALLYRQTFDLIGALLFVFGLLQAAIAWFALREGHTWALWALVIADLGFIGGWGLVFAPYVRAGIPILGGTILPPNLLVPLVLLVPATICAFIGLRQTAP